MGRYPVTEAANLLGISTEATRQRIKRGTLKTERDEEGNVFVLLKRTTADGTDTNTDGTNGGTHTNTGGTNGGTDDKERLIRFLSEQLDQEREVNRENRRIIAGLVQRVPELEAAPEPLESPQTASDGLDGTRGRVPRGRRRRGSLHRAVAGGGSFSAYVDRGVSGYSGTNSL